MITTFVNFFRHVRFGLVLSCFVSFTTISFHIIAFSTVSFNAVAEDEHGHYKDARGHDKESHEPERTINLSAKQLSLADIEIAPLTARFMDYQVYAPGEVKANGYTSYLVSPRIYSVVLRRHVTLGEHVSKGQVLVTLFSETMVDAQAAYLTDLSQWQRVQKLGEKTVGGKKYAQAQTDHKAAYSRLIAFGLSEQSIEKLPLQQGLLGEYSLNAEIAGAVLSDDFHQGQRVVAGEALIELADESRLWVDASLPANTRLSLPMGTKAQVKVGDTLVEAQVAQEAHTIDRETRTRVVRLIINNEDDQFHPGMFADVFFTFKTAKPVLAVPESALMRSSDGDWQVFVEEKPGIFKAQEVSLGKVLGKYTVIGDIQPDLRIVIKGAFFVASQAAKGAFDAHNH
ncbi:MAG: efflux RND transporter periplasmic adaptor subunit [Algicola sp.]|nr:efflux RND transporter periplasmic adaptor subunit [Algicola sp.]